MRTDPLTSHAAQVLARMKQRKRDDRAEARVLRLAVTPVTRVRFAQNAASVRPCTEV